MATSQQLQMFQKAAGHPRRLLEAYLEIQSSGNPISAEELRRLIGKHPERYSLLRGYAAPAAPHGEGSCE